MGTAGVTYRAADRGNGFAEFFAYLDLARRRFHVDQDALVRRGAEAEFTVNDDVDAVKARETNVELKLDCIDVLTGFETEVAVGIVEAVAEGGDDEARDLIRADWQSGV